MICVAGVAVLCSVMTLLSLRRRSLSAWRWAWATAAVTCLFCGGFLHALILFATNNDDLTRWLMDEQERRQEEEPAT